MPPAATGGGVGSSDQVGFEVFVVNPEEIFVEQ